MIKKVLLVEDDEFLSDMYKTKFEANGYEVCLVSNGEEALKFLQDDKNKDTDVVLLDVVMPKMDGIETLTKIKEDKKTKDFSVIMLTNLGQKEKIDEALRLGADGYLIKANYTPSEIIDEVNNILNNKVK